MIKYGAILFDLDGTLWDASKASADGWNAALTSLNIVDISVTSGDIRRVSGQPFGECVATLLPNVSGTDNLSLMETIDANERIKIEERGGDVYDGVVAGLRVLFKRHKLFLISNCQAWYLDAFFNHIPVKELFIDSNCYGRSGLSKTEMIQTVIQRYSLGSCIYIGDTEGDEQSARGASIDFGHVRYGFGESTSPDISFSKFSELITWACI